MKTEGCPYLGLRGDPHTFTAFASTANYCHRVSQPTPVDQAHQEACCLTAGHVRCPVFIAEPTKILPAELRAPHWQKKRQRGIGRVVLTLALLVVAAGLLYVAWLNRSELSNLIMPVEAVAVAEELIVASQTPPRPEPSSTPLFTGLLPVPTDAPTRTPTHTPTITPSATATDTPTPTSTPTTTPSPTVVVLPTSTATRAANALIIVDRANIRSGPGPDYAIVGVATRDQQFVIIGRTNAGDWWQVCCLENNERGWLFGELVTTLGDLSMVPVVLAPPPGESQTPVTP